MIVLVIGMHRSGTSALAGMLHQNGIVMGESEDFIPAPAPENPKGFFENVRFRHVNDLILSQNNYYVKNFSPMVPDLYYFSDQAKDIMRQLIWEYSKRHENWGFKDPRTCLTFFAWQQVFAELDLKYKIVFCYRPFEQIAASMLARGNLGSHEQFVALSHAYYRSYLKATCKKPETIVYFDILINYPNLIAGYLSKQLDYKIDNISIIDKNLAHNYS